MLVVDCSHMLQYCLLGIRIAISHFHTAKHHLVGFLPWDHISETCLSAQRQSSDNSCRHRPCGEEPGLEHLHGGGCLQSGRQPHPSLNACTRQGHDRGAEAVLMPGTPTGSDSARVLHGGSLRPHFGVMSVCDHLQKGCR